MHTNKAEAQLKFVILATRELLAACFRLRLSLHASPVSYIHTHRHTLTRAHAHTQAYTYTRACTHTHTQTKVIHSLLCHIASSYKKH